jgi:antitoxin VapB
MAIARVFKSGSGQAVKLPPKFRFKSGVVEIFRRGNEIVLRECSNPMSRAFDILAHLPENIFSEGRKMVRSRGDEGVKVRHRRQPRS